MSDTIAAIATGNIVTAIGIIRMSGTDALSIIDRVFRPKVRRAMSTFEDRQLVYGAVCEQNGEVLDFCLCTISRAPHSYTGENTAELQCHGSPAVLRRILELLMEHGARSAEPGEFTKRAFLNGCLDLTQAEAVIDLIEADTIEMARNAAAQLGGAVTRKTQSVYDSLSEISSHYHAVLDYPDEDIDEFRLSDYVNSMDSALSELSKLLSTFERGKLMKDGISTAIVGKPNVGKSSLLNALLGYDRAIVTDMAGTTRDTIEERLRIGELTLRLTDTAGLRQTESVVETMGIERSRQAALAAELVIAVFDRSEDLSQEDEAAIELAMSAKNKLAVINKTDLLSAWDSSILIEKGFTLVVEISSKSGEGLKALESTISKMYPTPSVPVGEILTNVRQADIVSRAKASVESAFTAMRAGYTPDIVLTETEQAMHSLGALLGRSVGEDIAHGIFSRFCVGK